MICITLTAQFW